MIPIPTRGLNELIKLVAVELPRDRNAAKIERIEQQIGFVRRYRLVPRDQETELIEMLINGAPLPDAVSELRARRRTPGSPMST